MNPTSPRKVESFATLLIRHGGPYTFDGFNLYLDLEKGDAKSAHAALRLARRHLGRTQAQPMRIDVTASLDDGQGDEPFRDVCSVYGWRAALVAARALRREYRDDHRKLTIHVTDPKLAAAWDELWCPVESWAPPSH